MKPKILVVGSSNTDMVIKAEHLPGPGETILGGTFFMNPGGKGANQAVAAARLGGNVTFICKTGDDIFGRQSLEIFEKEGIDASWLLRDPQYPSGVALITVDKNAENCIVVASGANAALDATDLEKAQEIIGNAAIVLLQLEIPMATVQYVAETAFGKGVRVVLNPAPAQSLGEALLRHISILAPNKKEAEMLTGITVHDIETAKTAAAEIQSRGVRTVIITLGSEGAIILDDGSFTHVPATPVEAVDTTAAGDVFNGALVVALAEGKTVIEATTFACRAAAISVTRLGAQSSAPYINEVQAFKSETNKRLAE